MRKVKVKPAYEPNGPSGRHLTPISVAWSDWEYCYSPLDGMLVHRKITPSIMITGTNLYTRVKRDNVE